MEKNENRPSDEPFTEARWIATARDTRIGKRRFTFRRRSRQKKGEARRAPLFRHEFSISDTIKSATMNICGLGYYEAWINQARVGDHVLDPAQTDYESRVFYVSHDITALVHPGRNCIGLMLGNGWYNQDRVWGRNGLSYGAPRLICELRLILADGSTRITGSNESWKWAPGPVVDNNIYAGERHEARLELPNWADPGFDDSSWTDAAIVSAPGGKLVLQEIPPIRKIEVLKPIKITPVAGGRHVVDMGQNFSGWARIHVKADAGTEITLRFAETVSEDGNVDTASTGVFATKVEQVDSYIARGDGVETWEPRFTYHGFRYVEVSGWPGDLNEDDISGIVIHTDLPLAGNFECSDGRLNRLHRMALWTHRSNIHGIPEDCPARERCGWLGDANMVAEFSTWNYNAKSFWEKYLDDIETTRANNNGIPGNVAPGKRGTRGPAQPDWAAAFILIPWYVHVQYGDSKVLNDHWRGMEELMEYYKKIANSWILEKGYGDWFDPGAPVICTNTPPSLTSTFWFYRCAQVMSSAASVLGLPGEEEKYASWAARIKDSAINEFFDRDEGSYESQTANAMALALGIIPAGEESRVLDALVADIRNNDMHLTTGIMGVRFLFEVLTRHGHGDMALALMHQDTYPSFGHLISRGATTLWEHWGEKEHDTHHGPRSLNHPMMGGFDNWFYNTLAGIRADPDQPGFKHFFLAPHPIPGLDWVRCFHESPFGRIESNWEMKDGTFRWTAVVPRGTSTTVKLPFSQEVQELGPGTHSLLDNEG